MSLVTQLHWNGETVRMYSRSGDDVEPKYPDLVTRIGRLLHKSKVGPCVLDGEIVPFDPISGDILPFSVLQKIPRQLGMPDIENSTATKIFVFDCLVKDGQDMTDRSLEIRKSALDTIFESIYSLDSSRLLDKMEYVSVSMNEASLIDTLTDLLMTAKREGFEGIMVKPTGPKSVYAPRSRSQWIKIKANAEEGDSALDTLDLVVMAAYKGSVK